MPAPALPAACAAQDVSLLRVTKLSLPAPTVGARITLVAQAPCNTVAGLTGGAPSLPYYLTQGPSTRCCPVNALDLVRAERSALLQLLPGPEASTASVLPHRNDKGERTT